jgi:hypothetical protein
MNSSHYNKHRLAISVKRPTRSLKTKWRTIEHDISKFVGCFEFVVVLNTSNFVKDKTRFQLGKIICT